MKQPRYQDQSHTDEARATERVKKSIPHRAVKHRYTYFLLCSMLALLLVLAPGVGTTFAKYIASGSGTGSASVAAFSSNHSVEFVNQIVNFGENSTSNLYGKYYVFLAEFVVTYRNTGEVTAQYDLNIKIADTNVNNYASATQSDGRVSLFYSTGKTLYNGTNGTVNKTTSLSAETGGAISSASNGAVLYSIDGSWRTAASASGIDSVTLASGTEKTVTYQVLYFVDTTTQNGFPSATSHILCGIDAVQVD